MADEYLKDKELSVAANFNFPLDVNLLNFNKTQDCVFCNEDRKVVQK
jgi:hypothetical protein